MKNKSAVTATFLHWFLKIYSKQMCFWVFLSVKIKSQMCLAENKWTPVSIHLVFANKDFLSYTLRPHRTKNLYSVYLSSVEFKYSVNLCCGQYKLITVFNNSTLYWFIQCLEILLYSQQLWQAVFFNLTKVKFTSQYNVANKPGILLTSLFKTKNSH